MFSLFSAQPMLVIATTGPLVLYDESLFQFCEANELDFLATRAWIGYWLAVIGLVFVAFEASVFVRFCTRFTQEVFASLVSLMFIMESLQNLYGVGLALGFPKKNVMVQSFLFIMVDLRSASARKHIWKLHGRKWVSFSLKY